MHKQRTLDPAHIGTFAFLVELVGCTPQIIDTRYSVGTLAIISLVVLLSAVQSCLPGP